MAGSRFKEVTMGTIHRAATAAHGVDLLPTAPLAATCLRLTLAAWWIILWWFKVGIAGMAATETFFSHYGLPAWLAWFDISFEAAVTLCLILGLYVPLMCIVSLPILRDGAQFAMTRTSGSQETPRWRKADSNSWSHFGARASLEIRQLLEANSIQAEQ
jgi:uncharacterized membrane protein YphA (DoxX/SURF4 family)